MAALEVAVAGEWPSHEEAHGEDEPRKSSNLSAFIENAPSS
jgi:hypothetical protein